MGWSDWSACSHSCWPGVSTRSRICVQGQYGGLECPALEEKQEKSCLLNSCTVSPDCILLEWGEWTQCTKTCLERNNPQYGTRTRLRQYEEADPNNPKCVEGSEIMQIDRNCAGAGSQIEECPIDATWGQWSEVVI